MYSERDIQMSVPRPRLLLRQLLRHADLFARRDRKEQVRTEGVNAMIFAVPEIEIQISRRRKPQFRLAFLEENGPVFDDLVFVA